MFHFATSGFDPLSFHVTSRDVEDREGTRVFTFSPGENQSYILLRTDKPVYQVGETATATVRVPEALRPYFGKDVIGRR